MDDIAPVANLLAALFRQVEVDSTDPDPRWRADVQRFLHNDGLAWWDQFLGMDGEFERQMHARLAQRQTRTRPSDVRQLAFFFEPTP